MTAINFLKKNIQKEFVPGFIFWLSSLKILSDFVYKVNYSIGGWILFAWLCCAFLFFFQVPFLKHSIKSQPVLAVLILCFSIFFHFFINSILFGRQFDLIALFVMLFEIFVLVKGFLNVAPMFKGHFYKTIFHEKKILFLLILLGIIRGAFLFYPGSWLSTVTLTNDDWKIYEFGSRTIMENNFSPVNLISQHLGMWTFLYYYYLAFLHFFLGEGIYPVVVMSFGLSMILVWVLVKIILNAAPKITPLFFYSIILFFIAFMEFEMHRYYTVHLLTDNLLLILISLLALEIINHKGALFMGIIFGFIYLCRMEFLPLFFIFYFYFLFFEEKKYLSIISFLKGFFPLFLIYPICTFIASDNFYFLNDSQDSIMNDPDLSTNFLKNFFILLGQYNLAHPEYYNRYHWYVLHFILLCILFINLRKKIIDYKTLFLLLGISFSILIIRSFHLPGIYGYRYSLPIILIEVYLIILFFIKRQSEESF